MTLTQQQTYDVGGILLDHPFKIRRLGHFGFNVVDMNQAFPFYTDLLGFHVSDVRDDGKKLTPEQRAAFGDTNGYFMHYGGDHHAFVLYNKRCRDLADGRQTAPGVTINQITWQVGSLAEVVNGNNWFLEQGLKVRRSGRDMPGSNWHTYIWDPEGRVNELFYGMEQMGWMRTSKPQEMHYREFRETPSLPQVSEYQELQEAIGKGIDLQGGYRYQERRPAIFDVDGILLPRPFKIVKLGPVSLFAEDLDRVASFYRDTLGFRVTEEVVWQGHRCVFLHANTEHHLVALYPLALRETLGFSPHTTSFALGLQLANYRQLRDAVAFLRDRGVRVVDVPTELHPGIDYAAHVQDPDGHVIQLYCSMEQVGWDGRTRPPELRHPTPLAAWPETIQGQPDSYQGEPFLGPWD